MTFHNSDLTAVVHKRLRKDESFNTCTYFSCLLILTDNLSHAVSPARSYLNLIYFLTNCATHFLNPLHKLQICSHTPALTQRQTSKICTLEFRLTNSTYLTHVHATITVAKRTLQLLNLTVWGCRSTHHQLPIRSCYFSTFFASHSLSDESAVPRTRCTTARRIGGASLSRHLSWTGHP